VAGWEQSGCPGEAEWVRDDVKVDLRVRRSGGEQRYSNLKRTGAGRLRLLPPRLRGHALARDAFVVCVRDAHYTIGRDALTA